MFISSKNNKAEGLKFLTLSWCLPPLVCDLRAHTPIAAMSTTARLHKEHTALLQSCPFLRQNLNLSSFNQESLKATFQCVLLLLVIFLHLKQSRKFISYQETLSNKRSLIN